ncbi:N-acetylmuramoyl-L-alanine amidase [Peptoniphilus sp. MSJ-1]|uniref:N-acetylmuramoyl-L-alanine amidase n=1 Tax=Peptoniphilus ovalis TaxID=2841503 RepID=A0ABS6FIQ9_9FIRM|nr:N-acetylmuramoyl-L-alanine amidase [Peptoniphilus ovalis]MBU5670060.1 N-acetylmuramoyl-L-alanine amidase [Peptoniphilus ovalis]
MKKLLKIIPLSMILLLQPVFAKDFFNVRINNNTYKVREAGVTVDRKEIKSEFKPYIKEGRTFVPIREVTESIGAKVDWNNKDKSVTITLNGKAIQMKINSKDVKIDGKNTKVDKDQVPQLTLYSSPRKETKTMVPLRFISETFGYDVDWNNDAVRAEITTVKAKSITEDNTKNSNSNTKNQAKTVAEEKKIQSIINEPTNSKQNYYQSNVEEKETEKINNKIQKGNVKSVFDEAELDLDDVKVKEKRVIKDKIYSDGKLKIVIDPGHGGKDSGAIAVDNKTYEKDLNLQVGEKLYEKLKSREDLDVIITRNRDEYVKLLDRAALSNDNEADIFLSIHFNSSNKESPNGIEVLYASEKNIQIKETVQKSFAQCLQNALIKETGASNRGIKNRPALIVLNKTKNVSALVELGFVSNRAELEKLKDPDYIDKLVNGLYNGIDNYIDNYVVK